MSLTEKLMPPIGSEADARRLARHGGNAGFLMAALILLAAAVNYVAADPADEVGLAVAVLLLFGGLIGFLAHRIRTGRGAIAGPALLALWSVNLALNIWAAQHDRDPFNPIKILIQLVLMLFVLNGARGCLWLRRPKAPAPAL